MLRASGQRVSEQGVEFWAWGVGVGFQVYSIGA